MYRLTFVPVLLCCLLAKAQTNKQLDSVDKIIIAQFITPAEQKAAGQEPQWTAISQTIKASYSDVQADRAVTKAQIYYYYSKDWPKFSTAIVHYTNAYEDKEDFKLMNKNANFILAHSQNMEELKAALGWVQHAADKEPSNTDYQQTVAALKVKIK